MHFMFSYYVKMLMHTYGLSNFFEFGSAEIFRFTKSIYKLKTRVHIYTHTHNCTHIISLYNSFYKCTHASVLIVCLGRKWNEGK